MLTFEDSIFFGFRIRIDRKALIVENKVDCNNLQLFQKKQYLATLGIVLFLFSKSCAESKTLHNFQKTKKPITLVIGFLCGERGIRTPGPVTVNSFQDCRNRPLCHFSSSLLYFCIASANIG